MDKSTTPFYKGYTNAATYEFFRKMKETYGQGAWEDFFYSFRYSPENPLFVGQLYNDVRDYVLHEEKDPDGMMPFETPLALVDCFCIVEKLIEMLDKKGIKVVHKEAFAPTIFKHQKELAKYVLTQAQNYLMKQLVESNFQSNPPKRKQANEQKTVDHPEHFRCFDCFPNLLGNQRI